MEMTGYKDGSPCWVDCSCSDIDVAADFYGALLGWSSPEGNPDFGGYRSATLNGRTVAGLMGQMEPGPVVWTTYFKVSDSEASVAQVTANGGSIMYPPMAVGELGHMSICVDPTGAVFGLWQPGLHTGAQVVNEPGAFCWSELVTTDMEAAKAFYHAVFGLGLAGTPEYAELQLDGTSVAGIMPKNEMMPADMPSNWGVYFAVENCDDSLAQANELGGSTLMQPMDVPNVGRMAVLTDPNGAPFNIIALGVPAI